MTKAMQSTQLRKVLSLKKFQKMLAELHLARISSQIMGFIGFPNETEADALETYHFLDACSEHWTLAGRGDFVLTAGAIVAN